MLKIEHVKFPEGRWIAGVLDRESNEGYVQHEIVAWAVVRKDDCDLIVGFVRDHESEPGVLLSLSGTAIAEDVIGIAPAGEDTQWWVDAAKERFRTEAETEQRKEMDARSETLLANKAYLSSVDLFGKILPSLEQSDPPCKYVKNVPHDRHHQLIWLMSEELVEMLADGSLASLRATDLGRMTYAKWKKLTL
jgi:hypothetical protein